MWRDSPMTHSVPNQEKTRQTATCLIYTRVSSKEQNEEGYSLAAQEKLLREYAAQNGLRIAREFQDVETAKRAGRSAFSDMLVYLRRHKSCRVILVEKTDRLYRNIKDWVTLDDLDVEVHFVKEGIVLSDQSRSSEKFIHGIKVLMAKNYCDNLSEETSKGMRQKASEGIWPSRAPVGYRNVMGDDGKRTIGPDPETGPIVTRLFKAFATGRYTQRELTKLAADMGLTFSKGTRVTMSYVLGILKNPLYMGEFVWNGERFRGRYEPLIDRETWKAAQEAFENRKKGRLYQDTSRWIFARLLRCSHCGCAMVGEEKKGIYIYYHCTKNRGECPARYVREETVALAFWKSLQGIRLRPEISDWLLTALKQSATDHREFTESQMDALVGRMKELRRRLDLIYKDRLDGRITEEQYENHKAGLEKDVMEAEAKIEGLNRADFKFYDKGVELLELVQRAVNAWESSDRSQKRVLLETVHSNCLWDGERVIPEYRQPFDLIALVLAGEKEKATSGEAALCDLEKWLPE